MPRAAGLCTAVSTACSSAANALGDALRAIQHDQADVMISGGADSKIHPLGLIRMSLLNQMSNWTGEPSGSLRPFDSQRSGWVGGEGSGIIILEEYEHATTRGAPPVQQTASGRGFARAREHQHPVTDRADGSAERPVLGDLAA